MDYKSKFDTKLIVSAVVLILGLLLLIGGGVMLGVGIHNNNQNKNNQPKPKYLAIQVPTTFSQTELQNPQNYKALVENVTSQVSIKQRLNKERSTQFSGKIMNAKNFV